MHQVSGFALMMTPDDISPDTRVSLAIGHHLARIADCLDDIEANQIRLIDTLNDIYTAITTIGT